MDSCLKQAKWSPFPSENPMNLKCLQPVNHLNEIVDLLNSPFFISFSGQTLWTLANWLVSTPMIDLYSH